MAGLGYLAGGLAATAAEIALIRNRHRFARSQLDDRAAWHSAAAGTPHGLGWLDKVIGRGDERWSDESFREGQLIWAWLPAAMFLPLFALLLFWGAIGEFLR
ncbi:MAG: hypothetical protein J2P27_14460 [Actinobacteria bacterium]|nr:hypothetical protein [Actinomycetota bacterium]